MREKINSSFFPSFTVLSGYIENWRSTTSFPTSPVYLSLKEASTELGDSQIFKFLRQKMSMNNLGMIVRRWLVSLHWIPLISRLQDPSALLKRSLSSFIKAVDKRKDFSYYCLAAQSPHVYLDLGHFIFKLLAIVLLPFLKDCMSWSTKKKGLKYCNGLVTSSVLTSQVGCILIYILPIGSCQYSIWLQETKLTLFVCLLMFQFQ